MINTTEDCFITPLALGVQPACSGLWRMYGPRVRLALGWSIRMNSLRHGIQSGNYFRLRTQQSLTMMVRPQKVRNLRIRFTPTYLLCFVFCCRWQPIST